MASPSSPPNKIFSHALCFNEGFLYAGFPEMPETMVMVRLGAVATLTLQALQVPTVVAVTHSGDKTNIPLVDVEGAVRIFAQIRANLTKDAQVVADFKFWKGDAHARRFSNGWVELEHFRDPFKTAMFYVPNVDSLLFTDGTARVFLGAVRFQIEGLEYPLKMAELLGMPPLQVFKKQEDTILKDKKLIKEALGPTGCIARVEAGETTALGAKQVAKRARKS